MNYTFILVSLDVMVNAIRYTSFYLFLLPSFVHEWRIWLVLNWIIVPHNLTDQMPVYVHCSRQS